MARRLSPCTDSAEPGTAPAQPLPGVRESLTHEQSASELPLGDASGDERRRRPVVDDGCQAKVLLCDESVLILAQEILQRLGVVDEALVGSTPGRRELGGVPRSLELDPKAVHRRVPGVLAEPPDGLRETAKLLPRHPLEPNALDSGRKPRRQPKSRQKQPVAIAVQDREQFLPHPAPRVLELRHERLRTRLVDPGNPPTSSRT